MSLQPLQRSGQLADTFKMSDMFMYCVNWIIEFVNSIGLIQSFLLCSTIILAVYWKNRKSKFNLPPGPTGLPILGYLPFLGSNPHKALHKLAHKYGSVFGLYFGRTYVVILNDFAAVKEAFSKSTTLDRPDTAFDILPDGVGFANANGTEWTEQRRFSLKTMRNLGLGKSEWERLIQNGADNFVNLISSFQGRPVDIFKELSATIANNIATFLFGHRTVLKDKDKELLQQFMTTIFRFFSQSQLRNFFPKLIDALDALAAIGLTQYAKTRKTMMGFNRFIRNQIDGLRSGSSDDNPDNFVIGYLKEIQNGEQRGDSSIFNEASLRGNVQAMFLGGSETTITSISWLMLVMASYPEIQKKVQEELDSVAGKGRRIMWQDRFSVPYTFAVVMEGLRWRTVIPLNPARLTTDDMKMNGYDIPKGTTVIANIWALHNDTNYWNDPDQFQPERFLIDDGKQVNTKPESYAPFSFGKRNCPGETIAMIEILLYLSALMKKFTILPLDGSAPIMHGTLGLTYQTISQELRFVIRE